MVTAYHGPGNVSKIIDRLPVKFIGGRLCLDFVNTVGGRDPDGAALRDKIGDYEELLAWSVLAGTVDRRPAGALARLAARDPEDAAAVLARAIRLREDLFRIFECAIEGRRPPDSAAETLRRELSIARPRQFFAAHSGRFKWTFPPPSTLDYILWPLPLSAAELLASDDLAGLRRCRGVDCGWLFLDSSRNHRRQWCDMRDCGNRAKVRRFRRKRTV